MTLSVNTNIPALFAQANLQRSSNRLNVSLERLSTGLRINSSADDPSGLVISEFQRAQLAGLSAASANIDRAISLSQTAEGGLSEVSGLLTELRTLVTDSANNGALDIPSLEANQANVTNILDTIDRIATGTHFGQQSLLDAQSGRRGLINSGGSAAKSDFLRSINDDVVVNQNLSIVITQNAERGFVTAPVAQTGALTQDEVLVINGVQIQLEAGQNQAQVIDRINQFQGQSEVFAFDLGGGLTELRSTIFGDGARVGVVSSVAAGPTSSGFGTTFQSDFGLDVVGTIGAGIAGASGSTLGAAEGLARLLIGQRGEAGSGVAIQLGLVNETDVATAGVTVLDNATITLVDNSRQFQIGAQAGDTANLTLPTVKSEALGIGLRPEAIVDLVTTVMTTSTGPPPNVMVMTAPTVTTGPVISSIGTVGTTVTDTTVNQPPVINATSSTNTTTMTAGNTVVVTTVETTNTFTTDVSVRTVVTETTTLVPPPPLGPPVPGPAIRTGVGAINLSANDDGSSPSTPLGFTANFFGTNFTNVFVNNNGNITFTSPLSTFTPFPILTTGTAIIAPFFADVDTRVGNTVTYGTGTVGGRPAFAANYINVRHYNTGLPLNSFQVVLIDRSDISPGGFDIEFNYDTILWEAGTASGGNGAGLGGNSARVGFSNGSTSSFELPGSAVNGAFLDSGPAATSLINNRRNSNVLGRYVFEVRAGSTGFSTITTTDVTTTTTMTMTTDVTTTVQVLTITEDPLTPNLRSIDIRNPDAAQRALAVVERSIEEVSNFRGEVGAFQRNILQTAQSNIRTQFTNLSAAESSLRDTDFTTELSALVSEQVRQNVSSTILGLANQNSLSVLDLLQGSVGG